MAFSMLISVFWVLGPCAFMKNNPFGISISAYWHELAAFCQSGSAAGVGFVLVVGLTLAAVA